MMSIVQEDIMGCGVACVAFIINKNYKLAKGLFASPQNAIFRGYYCRDIINALRKEGLQYQFDKVNLRTKSFLKKNGTIVFVKKSKRYPEGHYLVRTKRGWMNPWINFPVIAPVQAGFEARLPAKAQWVIYQDTS